MHPRTATWPDASQRARATSAILRESFLGELIEPPGGDIRLQLVVPHAGVELEEPLPELREFLGRETAHSPLDIGDGTHRKTVTIRVQFDNPSQPRARRRRLGAGAGRAVGDCGDCTRPPQTVGEVEQFGEGAYDPPPS